MNGIQFRDLLRINFWEVFPLCYVNGMSILKNRYNYILISAPMRLYHFHFYTKALPTETSITGSTVHINILFFFSLRASSLPSLILHYITPFSSSSCRPSIGVSFIWLLVCSKETRLPHFLFCAEGRKRKLL